MNRAAANFVGSIPEYYDRFLGPRIFSDYADDLASRVSTKQPRAVLELAAGTGIVSRKLRDALPSYCDLLATDLNPPMLATARSKFQADENISFEMADATNLPFEDNRFDVVVCQFGVMFFPDKEKSYAEVLRVLRPGGQYIFSVWGSWDENPFAAIAHSVVADMYPDKPPGFYKVPFGYHDTQEIHDSLMSTGFTQCKSDALALTSTIPSAKEFARGLVFGNPLLEEILSRGGDPDRVCAAIATAIESKLGSSMPLRAVIIEAS